MTPNEQRRLRLAEAITKLAMTDTSSGFQGHARDYRPTILNALDLLHLKVVEALKATGVKNAKADYITDLRNTLESMFATYCRTIGLTRADIVKEGALGSWSQIMTEVSGPGWVIDKMEGTDPEAKAVLQSNTPRDRAQKVASELGLNDAHTVLAVAIQQAMEDAARPYRDRFSAVGKLIADSKDTVGPTPAFVDLLSKNLPVMIYISQFDPWEIPDRAPTDEEMLAADSKNARKVTIEKVPANA